MSYINSGIAFFGLLKESKLLERMTNENPLCYIDYIQFHKELMNLFQGLKVTQSAIGASHWVLEQVKYVEDGIKNQSWDPWSDMDRIASFYREYITYERWKFETEQQARETRLKGLKLDLVLAENRNDLLKIGILRGKIEGLQESIIWHAMKGE
jgi:hypothetical protein